MSRCLGDDELADFVAGGLAGAALERATQHVDHCSACRIVVAAFAVKLDGAAPPTRAPGSRLGRFVIVAPLGEGAMGSVFAARDPELDRQVALKLVRPDVRDGRAQARLFREAQALARLHHDGVITVYEVGRAGDDVFIAMELLDGGTLAAWLASERRSVDEIVARFIRAGEGLAAAHAAGMVHRDFKPENVLLGSDGRQRVTDFGLVRLARNDAPSPPAAASPSSALESALTRDGTLLGTPAYMAPEQFDNVADARSDQFSFCVSLYKALYGELPFAATTIGERLAEVARGNVRPPPPGAEVPERLRAVVVRGLRLQPAERHASMDELLAALRAATRRRRTWRWIGAGIAVVVAATAAAIGVGRAVHAPWRAEIRELGPGYEENSDWADISPDGKSLTYVSNRDGDYQLYVAPLDGGEAHLVATPGSHALSVNTNYPRWTRDGRAILYRERDGGDWVIRRITLADGRVDDFVRGAKEADDCGGALLLIEPSAPGCNRCSRLVVRRDGVDRELYRGAPSVTMNWARCDRAGTRAVFAEQEPGRGHDDSTLSVIGLDGRGLSTIVRGDNAAYPCFAADGNSVIYARNGGIFEQPLAGGEPLRLTSGKFDTAPAVSPDGRLLLFDVDTTPWPMFAIVDGRQQRLTHKLDDQFEAPVLTPDGREIVVVNALEGGPQISTLRLDTRETRRLVDGQRPALSRDGRTLYFVRASGDGAEIMTGALDGGPWRPLARTAHHVTAMALGGDGALHLTVDAPDGPQAWRLGVDGALAREAGAPYGLVLPSPNEEWVAADVVHGERHELELVARGGALGGATNRRFALRPWVWDADGRALIAFDDGAFVRVSVDGAMTRLFERPAYAAGAAVSRDGRTLYASLPAAHVRRALIVNFADRPRRAPPAGSRR